MIQLILELVLTETGMMAPPNSNLMFTDKSSYLYIPIDHFFIMVFCMLKLGVIVTMC